MVDMTYVDIEDHAATACSLHFQNNNKKSHWCTVWANLILRAYGWHNILVTQQNIKWLNLTPGWTQKRKPVHDIRIKVLCTQMMRRVFKKKIYFNHTDRECCRRAISNKNPDYSPADKTHISHHTIIYPSDDAGIEVLTERKIPVTTLKKIFFNNVPFFAWIFVIWLFVIQRLLHQHFVSLMSCHLIFCVFDILFWCFVILLANHLVFRKTVKTDLSETLFYEWCCLAAPRAVLQLLNLKQLLIRHLLYLQQWDIFHLHST